MKFVIDEVSGYQYRVGESTEERRRIRQHFQDLLDEDYYQHRRWLSLIPIDCFIQTEPSETHWAAGLFEPTEEDLHMSVRFPEGVVKLDDPIPFVDEDGPGEITGYTHETVYDPDEEDDNEDGPGRNELGAPWATPY